MCQRTSSIRHGAFVVWSMIQGYWGMKFMTGCPLLSYRCHSQGQAMSISKLKSYWLSQFGSLEQNLHTNHQEIARCSTPMEPIKFVTKWNLGIQINKHNTISGSKWIQQFLLNLTLTIWLLHVHVRVYLCKYASPGPYMLRSGLVLRVLVQMYY